MGIETFASVMFVVFSTLMGFIIGSFLNVIIYRIPEGRTVVKGHSMCMSCGHELAARDLVPVFSWLSLGGKCRYCKAPVPSRYIRIESFTGLAFLIVALTHLDFQLPLYNPMNPLNLIIFAHFVLIILMIAGLISSMMIYHDKKQSFKGYTVYIGIGIVIMYILQFIIGVFSVVITNFLLSIGVTLGGIIINFLFCKIAKKNYTKVDFWLDLPYLLFYGFFGRLLIDKFYVVPAMLICFVIPRFIIKDSKNDKLTAIFSTCGLLVVTLIGYIINMFL